MKRTLLQQEIQDAGACLCKTRSLQYKLNLVGVVTNTELGQRYTAA